MKRLWKFNRWFMVLTFVFALNLGIMADKQKNAGPEMVNIKPDLIIGEVKPELVTINPDHTHRVRITVKVGNMARGIVCAGPFHVRLEKATPGGAFSFCNQQDIARLCSNPASGSSLSSAVSMVFEDNVPTGEQRVWRATGDFGNLIGESREDNNQLESAPYVAKTFCSGVDLILTRVEFTRNRNDGGVIFRGFGKNLCAGTCAGNIAITLFIPERPELGEISLPAGSGSISFVECDTGLFGAWGSREHDVSYKISIRFDPPAGCVDVNLVNNVKLVTLRAGETSKTFLF